MAQLGIVIICGSASRVALPKISRHGGVLKEIPIGEMALVHG